MVAKAVEWTATLVDAGGQWERKVKATKEDPERVGLEPVERGDGRVVKGRPKEETSLRTERGPTS